MLRIWVDGRHRKKLGVHYREIVEEGLHVILFYRRRGMVGRCSQIASAEGRRGWLQFRDDSGKGFSGGGGRNPSREIYEY